MSGECVVVLAAHPDDETLGAGGAICAHRACGDRVHVVVASEGVTARHNQAARQEECLRRAMARLGVDSVHTLALPDQRLDSLPLLEIVQTLAEILSSLAPTVLYVHSAFDTNQDHRALHAAALVLARPKPGATLHTLRAYETPSSTEWTPPGSLGAFTPNCYVDITPHMETKLAALSMYTETYASEIPCEPHPRSPAPVALWTIPVQRLPGTCAAPRDTACRRSARSCLTRKSRLQRSAPHQIRPPPPVDYARARPEHEFSLLQTARSSTGFQ